MAALNSPERQPPAAKKQAPAGAWKSPERPMTEAHVDLTPEHIIVLNDTVRVFQKSKGRRRVTKGLGWNFSFRLRGGSGRVHKRSTTMGGWAVDPDGRTDGAWRPGARKKIEGWIAKAVQYRGAQCQ